MVRERSEYPLTVLSIGSAREVIQNNIMDFNYKFQEFESNRIPKIYFLITTDKI